MEHDTSVSSACQSSIGMVAHPATPWTETPNWIFDEAAPSLDGAPLKVLLYVARRTRGFHRESDAISLEQFVAGITTRDGRQLDKGCGVRNRTTVLKALAELERRGYIGRAHGRPGRGKEATTLYFLRGPAAASGDRGTASAPQGEGMGVDGVQPAHPRGVQPAHPQKKVVLKQSSDDNDTTAHVREKLVSRGPARPSHKDGVTVSPPSPTPRVPVPRPTTSIGAPEDHGEAYVVREVDDPGARAIDLAVGALSVELGDDTPRASCARAHALRREAALSAAAFLALLGEAATRTRAYQPGIAGRRRDGRHKAIQYLFAVLDDLVDRRRHPALPGPIGGVAGTVLPAIVVPGAVSTPARDDIDEADPTWRAVLGELRSELTVENYARWFRPTRVVDHDEKRKELFIGVPDAFHQQWLDRRLRGCVERALARVTPGVQLTFVVDDGRAAMPGFTGITAADAGLPTSIEGGL